MFNQKHAHQKSTRGFGLLEVFLAKKRAALAGRLIGQSLRKGRILDIGCGSFPHFLLSTDFDEKYGIDLAVHKDRTINKNVILKRVDFEKEQLPFANSFFDVVVMLAVFEHVNEEEVATLLEEVNRVLKKGGLLVMTTPSPWASPLLWLLSRASVISKTEIDDHKSAFHMAEIKRFLSRAGFSLKYMKYGYFELYFNMWLSAIK